MKKQQICERYPDIEFYFLGNEFDGCIIGPSLNDKIIYSFQKCLLVIAKETKTETYGDALDYFYFNFSYLFDKIIFLNDETEQ